MEPVDTLIFARWIIPVVPRNRLLEDAAVAIRNGRIVAICPREKACTGFQAAEAFHLQEHVLIPGLVNAHTHAAMTLMRGIADDLPLMEWLNEHIWPRELRWVDPDFVRVGTRLAVVEMLKGGTTCFADMYFYPDVAWQVVQEAGIRAMLGLIFVDFPTPWARCPDEYFVKNMGLYQEHPADDRIGWMLAPHAPYSVSDEMFQQIAEVSQREKLRIHIHLHETLTEVDESLDRYRQRPLDRMARLGLLNERLMAVHGVHLEEGEIEQLANHGCVVVHCPESNLKLASGFCPVARLHQAEVPLGLGTDGAASNNDLDMLGEMRTAALLAKGVAHDPEALPAESALAMATMGGATALGLDDQIGSLEVGKWADITAIDLSWPETQPVYDPVSQIVYAASRHQVTDVWVGGRQLLANRQVVGLDWPELQNEIATWQQRLGQPLEL